MSKSVTSKTNFLGHRQKPLNTTSRQTFWPAALSVLILAALSIAAITPVAEKTIKNHAAYAADRGEQIRNTDTRQAIAYYQVASTLDPANQQYSQKLSDVYLKQGMVSHALDALHNARGQEDQAASLLLRLDRPDEAVLLLQEKTQKAPSGESFLLLSRAYLEKSAYRDAETAAERAGEYPASKEKGIILGVIAAKLQGQQAITHASVAPQEASRMLTAAKTGETPLAQLLYDLGLLRASQRVLEGINNQSAANYQLQAQIKLAQTPVSDQNLTVAVELLRKAIAITPQNIALHRQLTDVYNALGKNDAAQEEKRLIQLLEKGTP